MVQLLLSVASSHHFYFQGKLFFFCVIKIISSDVGPSQIWKNSTYQVQFIGFYSISTFVFRSHNELVIIWKCNIYFKIFALFTYQVLNLHSQIYHIKHKVNYSNMKTLIDKKIEKKSRIYACKSDHWLDYNLQKSCWYEIYS